MKNKLLLILSFAIAIFLNSTALASSKVSQIEIQGNKRIERATIEEYLGFKVGDEINAVKKHNAIRKLFETTLFDDVKIINNDGKILILLKETPLVSRVVFNGNTKIKTDMLSSFVYTTAGESLRTARLATDVEKIKEAYKRFGRYSIAVSYRVENLDNNRVKVIFDIKEGPKSGITEIRFLGNHNYRDSELKSIILSKESRWFRFLETNDTYDPDRIEADKYLLKQFYNSLGYADFKILSVNSDLSTKKDGFELTYSIEEGDKYKFNEVTILNKIQAIDSKQLMHFTRRLKNRIFNAQKIENVAEKISNYLASKGYPQLEVYPDYRLDRNGKVVDVVIIIEEARKVYISKFNIEGNLKTLDHVIRRNYNIDEGDIYNGTKLEKGEQNIRNLDYFEKVQMSVTPTKKEDRYDVNLNVEEKSTSSIGLAVGYSTIGGAFGNVNFLERNLVGTGKILNAGVQVAAKSINYTLGITEPYFMDRNLALGVALHNSSSSSKSGFENGEQNYSKKSTGVDTSLSYDISEDLLHTVEYSISQDDLSSSTNNSVFIQEQLGRYNTSAIGHTLSLDKLDSRIFPKNGFRASASQEYAGLGGNNKYLKHSLDFKGYKSFYDNNYTLTFRANGGVIKGIQKKKVRISDRFNLGDSTLRGFDAGGIGPRDKVTGEGLGGQKFYSFGSEFVFPVGLPKEFNVSGSTFIDAGSLWDADSKAATRLGFHNDQKLRTAVGFGVIWITKFAPIKLYWGFPLNKQPYDNTRLFSLQFVANL